MNTKKYLVTYRGGIIKHRLYSMTVEAEDYAEAVEKFLDAPDGAGDGAAMPRHNPTEEETVLVTLEGVAGERQTRCYLVTPPPPPRPTITELGGTFGFGVALLAHEVVDTRRLMIE